MSSLQHGRTKVSDARGHPAEEGVACARTGDNETDDLTEGVLVSHRGAEGKCEIRCSGGRHLKDEQANEGWGVYTTF